MDNYKIFLPGKKQRTINALFFPGFFMDWYLYTAMRTGYNRILFKPL